MPAHRPVLHENLSLIEVRDEHILTLILADPSAAAHIAVRLSDRVAAVLPGRLEALAERLRKLGHLPRTCGHH
jgi:hypothetical protein